MSVPELLSHQQWIHESLRCTRPLRVVWWMQPKRQPQTELLLQWHRPSPEWQRSQPAPEVVPWPITECHLLRWPPAHVFRHQYTDGGELLEKVPFLHDEPGKTPLQDDLLSTPVRLHRHQEDGREFQDEPDIHHGDRSVCVGWLPAGNLQLLQASQRAFYGTVGFGYHVRALGRCEVFGSEVVLVHGRCLLFIRAFPDQLYQWDQACGERF